MTTIEAILVLINEAQSDNCSVTGYRRVLRAMKPLGFTVQEASMVLHRLEYTHEDGTTYEWLSAKLRESKREAA